MIKNFAFRTLAGALLFSGAVRVGLEVAGNVGRNPSSVEDSYELTIQSLGLDATSRLEGFKDVFIRGTFGKDRIVELGRNEAWTIGRGETKQLGIKLDIQKAWIQNDDTMDFTLEIVQKKTFETVLVRCSQVAREMSAYNRSYQCSIPNESLPVLSYRVGRKGSTPNATVAQLQ